MSRLRQVRLYNTLSPGLVRCGRGRNRDALKTAAGPNGALRRLIDYVQMTGNSETALHGQMAVVTGSGGGIGAAIARRLAPMGALTFLCGRRRSPLQGTAETILKSGGQAEVAECDVTNLSSVEALAALVERKSGRADILVNNAGVGSFAGPLHQMPPAFLGAGHEYESARRVLLHAQLLTHDDSRPQRAHREHFFPGGKECAAQWGRICRLQMGAQRPELFGRGGVARLQHPGIGGLSGIGAHRSQSA